ncbi:MAG: hypothetical protein ABI538_00165 [Pseudoxanthomonas sp.]
MQKYLGSGAISALALSIGLTVFPAQQALAVLDNKGISATECQPFLPTTYAEALFVNNAIYNPTNVNQRVICPINQDADVDWEAGKVTLRVHIKAGATPGKVACTVYGRGASFGGSQFAYTATSPVVAAGVATNFEISGIADNVSSPYLIDGWNVLCTLNAGMSLGGFRLGEDYDTDSTN